MQIVKLNHWIENKSDSNLYSFYLALVLMLCSLIFALPDFSSFDPNSYAWQAVNLKASDLTNSLNHIDPGSWLSKKVFRLTVPVIIRITHFSPVLIIGLQYLLGYLSLIFCYKLSLRILRDPVSATFFTTAVVFTYFGRAGFYDLKYTWFDGFAFFFLITAMYSRRFILILLFSIFASWVDERGFISLTIILLFHQLLKLDFSKLSLISFTRLNKNSLAVLMAMILYLAIRGFLTLQYNMHTNSVGANLSTLEITAPFLIFGAWTFLEGLWMVYIYSLVQSFKRKDYIFSIIILIVLVTFIIVSGCVTDITRSGSYMVPVIFIVLIYLQSNSQKEVLRNLMFKGAIISLLFPAIIVCPDWGLRNSISSVIITLFKL